MTYEGFSIRGSGLTVPFGAAGVAGAMAVVMALIGLLLPTAVIESIAFQLYLDTIFPAAVAPFGWTAHLVAALAFAVLGAAIGGVLAWFFRVSAGEWTLRRLINRLRGIGADDDADAPELRAADRHPDAPARRPFTVSTDLPAAGDGRDADYWPVGAAPLAAGQDEGELLLDHPFNDDRADHDEGDDELALSDYPVMTPDSALADPVDVVADLPGTVAADPVDDWADAVVAPDHGAGLPDADGDTLDLTEALGAMDDRDDLPPAVAGVAQPVATPPPVDLSIGRLDELLARLEAGLANRAARPAPAADAGQVVESDGLATDGADAGDTATCAGGAGAGGAADDLPDDPALAAALATLRRMTQHVG